MGKDLTFLGNKAGFNLGVRHCKKVIEYLGKVSKKYNIADVINNSLTSGDLESEQINPILGTLIVDKFEYNFKSFNLPQAIEKFDTIINETSKWTGIDLIISYFHPKLKQCVINPKIKEHWEKVGDLAKDEIIVIYAKLAGKEDVKTISSKAIDALIKLIETGEAAPTDKDFVQVGAAPKVAPAPPKPEPKTKVTANTNAPKPSGQKKTGKRRMTPKVSVQVTNELFHNGNVEAWKNIIESYVTKFKGCEVVVFYDNEYINNLNSLFKWGKVKMGSVILFSVVGVEFSAVSKLKRYLFEGASSRYEKFLDKDVNKVLNLF